METTSLAYSSQGELSNTMRWPVLPGIFSRQLVAVLLALLLACLPATPVRAQKGRSYSSGSSSSVPTSRGSFSSRSSSSAPASRGGFSAGSSSGRSKGWSYDSAAGSAQSHWESKRRYEQRGNSTGSWNQPSTGRDYSSGGPIASPPKGRDYSVGGGWQRPPKRPDTGNYDVTAAEAQRHEESRKDYTKGEMTRPNYPDPKGKTRPIDPSDPGVVVIRRRAGWNWWIQRERRQSDFGRRYPPPPGRPPVIYSDPYSAIFWYWLLQQELQTRALWAYHHQNKMDPARYDELTKDEKLATQVSKLEKSGVERDPSYVPPGIDSDLMYTADYVDAVVNPKRIDWTGIPTTVLNVLAKVFLVLLVMAFLFWLVFVKTWGEAPVQRRQPRQGKIRRRKR
jgi:hypothetical protein